MIDLPGVKDRDKAVALVGKTAELRFRPVLSAPAVPSDGRDDDQGARPRPPPTDDRRRSTHHHDHARPAEQRRRPRSGGGVVRRRPRSPRSPTVPDHHAGPATQRNACVGAARQARRARPRSRYHLGPAGAHRQGGVSSAEGRVRQPGQGWTVNMNLTDDGRVQQVATTLAQQQFHKQVAIVLDGVVQSAPAIQTDRRFAGRRRRRSPATSARARPRTCAKLLKYGALPVQLKQLNVESVSPTLGQDQLDAGHRRRPHRPRARRALHARLLPAARPRRDRRPRCSPGMAFYTLVTVPRVSRSG